MKREAKIWFEQAQEHHNDALYCLEGRRYGLSLYCFHQALEKIFKAAIVEFAGKIPPKSHQLDHLLKGTSLSAPSEGWYPELAKITQHFWRVRYPDLRLTRSYSSTDKIKSIVKCFDEVFLWAKDKLTK